MRVCWNGTLKLCLQVLKSESGALCRVGELEASLNQVLDAHAVTKNHADVHASKGEEFRKQMEAHAQVARLASDERDAAAARRATVSALAAA